MSCVNVWWPMYPADFAIDTQGMSLEQVGAYVRLCNLYWRNEGKLLGTDAYFANVLGVSLQKWKALRPVMERYFTVTSDGTWCHERLDAELARARSNRQKKQKAAQTRWNPSAQSDAHAVRMHESDDANGYAPASDGSMHMQCPSPSPSPSPKDPTHASTERGGLRGCGSEEESLAELAKRLGGKP